MLVRFLVDLSQLGRNRPFWTNVDDQTKPFGLSSSSNGSNDPTARNESSLCEDFKGTMSHWENYTWKPIHQHILNRRLFCKAPRFVFYELCRSVCKGNILDELLSEVSINFDCCKTFHSLSLSSLMFNSISKHSTLNEKLQWRWGEGQREELSLSLIYFLLIHINIITVMIILCWLLRVLFRFSKNVVLLLRRCLNTGWFQFSIFS